MKVPLPRAWNLTPRLSLNELKFWILYSFFVVEIQTSSCLMKVSLPRAWNLTPRLGSNELKCWFIFSFNFIELQASRCFMKVSLSRTWNLSPRLGSHELKFWFISFSLLDWTSNLELFYEGPIAKSLKSDLKGWLKWAEILNFLFSPCGWTSNLKLFYEGLVAESLKSEPKAWLTWAESLIYCFHSLWLNFKAQTSKVGSNDLRIWFFLFFVVELQSSSYFMKVSLRKAWNVTPRLGSNELKFKVLFSIMWLNFKPQALLWRSHCRELEIWPQGLA
jgi:hypothetical protein